jgi:hypothetical protein
LVLPQAFEITANKAAYKAINPAQVMMHREKGSQAASSLPY